MKYSIKEKSEEMRRELKTDVEQSKTLLAAHLTTFSVFEPLKSTFRPMQL